MTSTQTQLESAREAVNCQPFHLKAAYVNVHALREVLNERKQVLLVSFGSHPYPQPLDIGNSISHSYHLARDCAEDYVRLAAMLALLESTDDFKEAESILAPLVSDFRELEIQLAEENRAAAHAAQERRDALAEAEAEALAAVRAKFAAPPAPAPPAPPAAPFRAKGIKPTVHTEPELAIAK